MTIHAAKGLEFPVVFVAAVEKDMIPHVRSVEEEDPEAGLGPGPPWRKSGGCSTWPSPGPERRLYLSWCASRRRMGKPVEAFPSPFLDELPAECLSWSRQRPR